MKYGLIGEKLGHSFSKIIHSQIADYEYELKELTESELHRFLEMKDFAAVNVTIPYKKTVIPYLDSMSEAAKSIGAVNCILNQKGVLTGHNTDFDGLRALITSNGVNPAGKKVLILGTGGTSDTAKAVCENLGASEILKVSRSGRDQSLTYEEAMKNHRDSHMIINATPCGMYPNNYDCPIDISDFDNLIGVFDCIYNPLRSMLVTAALKRGIPAAGGLYMLTAQAVYAYEFFLSTKCPEGLIDRIYAKTLAERTNIVLTGMPASGKSTIGKLIAEKAGRKFVDTDPLIEERAKMPISDIFAKYGEKHFRDLETEIIEEISKENSLVIATGGGAVLREKNIDALKSNGRIYFLDRPVSELCPTDDRPLASSKEKIIKLHEERLPVYQSTCDAVIQPKTPEEGAEEIISEIFACI